jgi:hypothetical protein
MNNCVANLEVPSGHVRPDTSTQITESTLCVYVCMDGCCHLVGPGVGYEDTPLPKSKYAEL